MSYCPYCGRKLKGHEFFCPRCGNKLSPSSGVPERAGNRPGKPERTHNTFGMGSIILVLAFVVISVAIGIILSGLKKRNRTQETMQPEKAEVYILEGDNYASTSLAKVSGKLVKADETPPFANYSISDESVDCINYEENEDFGYQYIVENRWGLQLEEPIQVEYGGQVTTVKEIGLGIFGATEYPALEEGGSYYCEGVIQNVYQMGLDSFRGKGDDTLVATEKNIDRKGYWEGDSYYTSIHEYYPFGNYQISISVMKRIDGDKSEQESTESEPQEEGSDSSLSGWAGAERKTDVSYDQAERNLEYMLSSPGQGKDEFRGNCEIVMDYTSWQTGDTYSSSFQFSSSAYTAEEPSDLGLLYAAADDYNGDGTADLISFRTEAVTDVSGNPWVFWYFQLETCGSSSSTYEFGDKLRDAGDLFFAVYDHYLIKITRDYGVGDLWPLSEEAAEEEDVTFEEITEVQDIHDNFKTIFLCKREAADYLPNLYSCVLETPGERDFWNIEYSSYDNVTLNKVIDEEEMLTIIEGKLERIFGKPVISFSPLRFENRWSALSFAEPSSVLHIETVFDPIHVEDRDNGSKRVGTTSFTVKTVTPDKGTE